MPDLILQMKNIGMNKIRVVKGSVGGGFGGKQEPVYEPLNAVLALKAGRPVMLEITREECLACTRTRHSVTIQLKSGVDKNGRILAREASAVQNTGAYSSHGHNVMYSMGKQFMLLYPTPNLRFKGTTAYTNILIAGAMRGYGAPQMNFALESHIDHIAHSIGMDPLDVRLKNCYRPGDAMLAKNMTVNSYGLLDVIALGAEKIGYKARNANSGGKLRTGIGMAIFGYEQCCFGSNVELSGARIMMNEDATASLFIGCAEIGQGSDTVMQQIAAEALGIPLEWITVIGVDTDLCPFDVGAFASRQTYMAGHAVKKAGLACKNDILSHASRQLDVSLERLDICDGYIIDGMTEKRLAPVRDITMNMVYNIPNPRTICHDAYHSPDVNVVTFGVTFAKVEVDTGTGKVRVLDLVTALDSGKIINPSMAMGQLLGGSIMSVGYGLLEQILLDSRTGRVLNDNLLDYKIPTFADVPPIRGYFVETDEPAGAYGNKSLGEPPNITPATAIRNAVYDALGIGINQLPLTPERVLLQLKSAGI